MGLYGYPATLNKVAFGLTDPKGAWNATKSKVEESLVFSKSTPQAAQPQADTQHKQEPEMLRNILILFAPAIMLSGCLPDLSKYSTKQAPSKPVIDANAEKVVEMWIPREMRMIESRGYIARAEEEMCSEGYYVGKYITKYTQ